MVNDDACELLCLDLPHAERIRAAVPGVDDVESAAGHARAMGEPTRLRIAMALLVGDELCVCDMAWVVGASQALVSHHLRQLRTAGLVASRKDGRMVMYRLTDRGRLLVSVLLDVEDPRLVGKADRV
ncbi:regulatory protein ArsR [Pseudonocardia dioxanivorans CB1190]|uniref:Regulatory protein ArsR n=1 Tax=Pseudonocardia dioxanivorans (strain ATCC 55486 / DSM 44775 / JCM 13855 / CB1190) TaxID=675635 RepID=F4CXG1_PSEUX|nr:metalloregulator ArsR/SmtB family transcription factor [Pseudonocardia dioxanivorans]AEA26535.1 regulatory protein ArsR [Pseudonocardia dioxanivorans CB1190]